MYLLRVIGEFIYLLLQEKKQIQEQRQPGTWRAVCYNQGIRILGMSFCCSFTAQNLQWQSLKLSCSGAELLKEKMKFGKLKSPIIIVPKYMFFSLFCWCSWCIHCFYTTVPQKVQLLWISVTPCCSVGVCYYPGSSQQQLWSKGRVGITVWLKERISISSWILCSWLIQNVSD